MADSECETDEQTDQDAAAEEPRQVEDDAPNCGETAGFAAFGSVGFGTAEFGQAPEGSRS